VKSGFLLSGFFSLASSDDNLGSFLGFPKTIRGLLPVSFTGRLGGCRRLSQAESGLLPSGFLGLASPGGLPSGLLGFPEAVRGFSPVRFPPPGLCGGWILGLGLAGLGMAGGTRRDLAETEKKNQKTNKMGE
jgi:hypothetical protein